MTHIRHASHSRNILDASINSCPSASSLNYDEIFQAFLEKNKCNSKQAPASSSLMSTTEQHANDAMWLLDGIGYVYNRCIVSSAPVTSVEVGDISELGSDAMSLLYDGAEAGAEKSNTCSHSHHVLGYPCFDSDMKLVLFFGIQDGQDILITSKDRKRNSIRSNKRSFSEYDYAGYKRNRSSIDGKHQNITIDTSSSNNNYNYNNNDNNNTYACTSSSHDMHGSHKRDKLEKSVLELIAKSVDANKGDFAIVTNHLLDIGVTSRSIPQTRRHMNVLDLNGSKLCDFVVDSTLSPFVVRGSNVKSNNAFPYSTSKAERVHAYLCHQWQASSDHQEANQQRHETQQVILAL